MIFNLCFAQLFKVVHCTFYSIHIAVNDDQSKNWAILTMSSVNKNIDLKIGVYWVQSWAIVGFYHTIQSDSSFKNNPSSDVCLNSAA